MKIQFKSLAIVAFASAISFFGCNADVDDDGAVESNESLGKTAEALAMDAPPLDYVRTPGGFVHKSCVHALPEGGTVDDSVPGISRAMKGGRELFRHPKCSYPRYRQGQNESSSHVPGGPGGWIRSVEASLAGSSTYFDEVHAKLTVPSIPSSVYNGGTNNQLVYIFPSVQNNYRQILQPVLQYGGGSHNNGPPGYTPTGNWTMAAWLADSHGGYWYSPSINVLPGDFLITDTTMQNLDASGNQTWSVGAQDTRTGQIASMYYYSIPSTSTYLFNNAEPLVLEAYGVSACSQLPTSMSASDIYIKQSYPFWNSYVDPGSSQVWTTAPLSAVCSTTVTSDRPSHSAPNTVTITIP